VLDLLPDILAAVSDPAVAAASDAQAREAALLVAANALVTAQGLTAASMPTVVAVNTQTSTTTPVVAATPAPSIQLHTFSFTSAGNYFARFLTGSTADNTPDTSNKIRYIDRRFQATSGNVAAWSTGSNPSRNADLHWNGSAWVNCPINFPQCRHRFATRMATAPMTSATSAKPARATEPRSMSGAWRCQPSTRQIRDAGYTNLSIVTPTDLGTATFPAGSSVFYQTSTPLTNAFAYYPGSGNPVGVSDVVNIYSAAVSAGGDATTQPPARTAIPQRRRATERAARRLSR
jgi:hypothetical protein